MTISTEYSATKYINTGQTEFPFTWESIGLAAIEVWAEFETDTPGVYDRVLARPDLYTVRFGGVGVTYSGGTVVLNQPSSPFVARISIERNTLITQTVDLKNFGPFKMPVLEFMLDKMVMIIQELADRKCGVSLPSPALQPFFFYEYTVLSATVVDAALQAVISHINLIESMGTDCTSDPEGT
jgi:hypothetical protein